jgi:hypothetical protein
MWRGGEPQPAPAVTVSTPPAVNSPAVELLEAVPERSLFDDLVSLSDEEQEQFRQMLESADAGVTRSQ